MFDAIIVGARCAGSPVGMLLARKGYSVLVVDRDTFPSDTLSTAFMQDEAAERLDRWGLLGTLAGAGTPGVEEMNMHAMGMTFPSPPGKYPHYSPRRTVLDTILVEAAREAGADVREGFSVRELVRDESGRVTGIKGRDASGADVEESARIVIGADGRNSFVAKEVGAEEYRGDDPTTCGYYAFFNGVDRNAVDLFLGDNHAIFHFPTNGGQACIAAEAPVANFQTIRADPETYMRGIIARSAPALAPHMANATVDGKWFGMQGRRSYFRKPYGPGWALCGDAGYLKDPIQGTGIDDAFRDADNLADALDAIFSGGEEWDVAMTVFHQKRDAAQQGKYEVIVEMAKLQFTPEFFQQMMAAPGAAAGH
jgi:flavin-dependent dehydrogenase